MEEFTPIRAHKFYLEGQSESGETYIEHQAGEVWLIIFWTYWDGASMKPMARNQQMIETKGEEWGSKVKIIGVSFDTD